MLIECRVALVQTLLGVKFCFISSATHTRARHTHIIEPHSFRRTHAHWHTMRVRDSGHTRFATSWVKLVRIFDWRIAGTSLTIIGPCCFVSSPCSLDIFAKCWKREDGGKNLGENKDVNEKRRRASSCWHLDLKTYWYFLRLEKVMEAINKRFNFVIKSVRTCRGSKKNRNWARELTGEIRITAGSLLEAKDWEDTL